jgi:hypothetical protein
MKITVELDDHLVRWFEHFQEHDLRKWTLEKFVEHKLEIEFLRELQKGNIPDHVMGDHIPF